MVKGISKQVIVVHSPDPKLFEQAIFILKENISPNGVLDAELLREAQQAIASNSLRRKYRHLYYYGAFWICVGAAAMGSIWFLASFL